MPPNSRLPQRRKTKPPPVNAPGCKNNMNTDGTPTRFQRFVVMHRKWFSAVFLTTLVLCGIGLRGKYHSLVELVGFSLAGALLLTTLISLASIPVVWVLAGRQLKNNTMNTNYYRILVSLLALGLALDSYAGDIHEAVRDGNLAKVGNLLKANPQLVKAREPSHFDSTPLHLAAMDGNAAMAELLLAKGAEIDATDCGGWTPLMRAVANKHKKVVELLLAKNANVNLAMDIGRTALHYAVMNDDLETTGQLLSHQADTNVGSGGEFDPPPLHAARSVAMVELLLSNHADVNVRNRSGETALHAAALFNSKEIANALLSHKADVNAVDKTGRTPLHWAAWRDCPDVALLLLKNGADATAKDREGGTPLQIATSRNHKDMIALLQGHEAKGTQVNGR